ncbi:SHOCT domain-containing protein [Undibacterium sp. FT147W]|uniref:SHOCT domain-containing protein n=1 Tax=Undibacterium rivi TaxID=2828729 RepID=A0ABS5H1D4_9BURK|nr:SHOCT domain-containing protein [Undibacterium rivi]MBR7792199.1 SHOCT domain-containing protein [Undibacterium rivi]
MGLWIWAFLFIAVGLVIFILPGKSISKRKQEMELKLKSIDDFNSTQQIIGCDGKSGLAIDEDQRKLCLITNNGTSVLQRVIDYKGILSVELFEGGTSVTKTVRSSQIGGALVGGLLLGGVGALVGGLSGKTETSGKINRIDLRLIVNDTNAPLHDVAFMNFADKKDGIIYTQAMQMARRWHGILEVLVKRADAEEKGFDNKEREVQSALPSTSVADEIKKLADLHQSGLLTLDEFQQQKTKLLGADKLTA